MSGSLCLVLLFVLDLAFHFFLGLPFGMGRKFTVSVTRETPETRGDT